MTAEGAPLVHLPPATEGDVMTATKTAEREDALTRLRELFPPGATAYTVLRSVSRSGMSRKIDVFAMTDIGPYGVSYLVARATRLRRDRSGALVVQGAGMDMGCLVVYTMSWALYPDGYPCAGERCPSPDHVNLRHAPESVLSAHYDGYAVSQRWL